MIGKMHPTVTDNLCSFLPFLPTSLRFQHKFRYERGSFLVFDSMAWDIVRKDNFVLQYQSLEQSLSARQQQQPPFQQQQQVKA